MIKFHLTYAVVFLLFLNCAVNKQRVEDKSYLLSDEKTILNYNKASRSYKMEIIKSHYRINIEIEEPFIIIKPVIVVDHIYRISHIQGTTVFLAQIDKKGNINSSKIVKSGGLGLDKYAEDILKNIKINPAYHRGKVYKSSIYINIVIKEKNRI